MHKVFIKNYDESPKDIISSLFDIESDIQKKIEKIDVMLFLFPIITGFTIGFCWTILTLSGFSTENFMITTMLSIFGALIGTFVGLGLTFIKIIKNKLLKNLFLNQKNQEYLLLKLLKEDNFQHKFISHIEQLENSLYINGNSKSAITKFRMDLISSLYDNNYKEANHLILTNIKLLNNVQAEVYTYLNKEDNVNAYLKNKNIISQESSKDIILSKSFGSINYDYRNQV